MGKTWISTTIKFGNSQYFGTSGGQNWPITYHVQASSDTRQILFPDDESVSGDSPDSSSGVVIEASLRGSLSKAQIPVSCILKPNEYTSSVWKHVTVEEGPDRNKIKKD